MKMPAPGDIGRSEQLAVPLGLLAVERVRCICCAQAEVARTGSVTLMNDSVLGETLSVPSTAGPVGNRPQSLVPPLHSASNTSL